MQGDFFAVLFALLGMIWVALSVLVFMFSRRRALAMQFWLLRAVRRMVGGIFLWIGNTIRGR